MLRKACPRCHGDLYVEKFHGSVDVVCLQCGHELTPRERVALVLARMKSQAEVTSNKEVVAA